MQPLREGWNEGNKHVGNGPERLIQRTDNGILGNVGFRERYINSEAHILIHFRISGSPMEFVACLQRCVPSNLSSVNEADIGEVGNGHSGMTTRVNSGESSPVSFVQTPGLILGSDSQEYAVFIDIVKSVETPQMVIPTLIWFDRVDAVYGILPQAGYLSSLTGPVVIGGIENWKSRLLAGLNTRSSDHEKLVSQVIQCRPAVVDYIADKDAYPNGNIPNTQSVIDQLSRLRILLGPDYVWCGLAEGRPEKVLDFKIEFGEMLSSPI
jgi:hypothetical protein